MRIQRFIYSMLVLCLCGVYLLSQAHQSAVYAQSGGPSLSIPTNIKAGSPGTVEVPVVFQRNQSGVAGLTFSISYDPACLAINGNNAEGAVSFSLPSQMRGSGFFDVSDTNGQLDIAIADYAPPLTTLPDSKALVTITFTVVCTPPAGQTITTPVRFSQTPPASFSNTLGRSVNGSVVDGAVIIQRGALPTTTPPATSTPVVTPEPANTAPEAADDTATTREYRAVTIAVLANDSDADDDNLSVTEITQGGLGQVSIQADNTLLYVPEPGRNGGDLFSYTVSDGRGGLAEALVRVSISEFNIPPTALDDTVTTNRDQAVQMDLLENDFDADAVKGGPGLTILVLGQPAHGTAQLNADSSVTYSPALDYSGPDQFLYTIVDSEGGSSVAKVVITVNPVNHPPEVEPTTEETFEAGHDVILQILATDPDGDTNLHYSATGLPPGLSIDPATGKIVGTIDPAAKGVYNVTATVSDGQSSTTIDFTLTVTQPPPARFVSYMPLVGR